MYSADATLSDQASPDLLQYLFDSLQNFSSPVDFDFSSPPDIVPQSVSMTEPPLHHTPEPTSSHSSSQASTPPNQPSPNQPLPKRPLPATGSDTSADDEASRRLQRRRHQNNLSARRTRQRKQEYQQDLESSVKSLQEDLDATRVRTAKWQRKAEHWETIARALKGMLRQNGIEFELPEYVED